MLNILNVVFIDSVDQPAQSMCSGQILQLHVSSDNKRSSLPLLTILRIDIFSLSRKCHLTLHPANSMDIRYVSTNVAATSLAYFDLDRRPSDYCNLESVLSMVEKLLLTKNKKRLN